MAEYETTTKWRCHECDLDFTQPQFLDHLPAVHQIQTQCGRKKLIMHIDVAGGFSSSYEWQIATVRAMQMVYCRKVKKKVA